MIQVERKGDGIFQVTVEGARTTTHRVTVSPACLRRLTGGRVPAERLVEASFEFLLERESNTSILASFDLPVIGNYFPEYEGEIRKRLSRRDVPPAPV